jgi:pimeloyl-ACP methyl ester carboxylesterase
MVCALVTIFLLTGGIAQAGTAMTNLSPDAESRFAMLDGARVHYKSYGKGGEAVVFIHGWTCDISFWRMQIPAFETKTRVIAIDLPGHGRSDKPQIAYTMDLFARAIDAVLSDAKIDHATLVGHSMGTPVVRQFYRKYPEKTRALVLVDGGLRMMADKATWDRVSKPLRGPNYKEAAGRMIDDMTSAQASPALREEIKTAMLSTPQHVAVSAMDGRTDSAIYQRDKINVPVLVVLAKSPYWYADNEWFFRSLAPNLEYHMWEGVSHFLMMDKPKEFNETVLTFLTKNNLIKK